MRILVLGLARSGTTWIVDTLSARSGATAVNEPDNIDWDPVGNIATKEVGFYAVVEPGSRAPAYTAIWDLAFAGGWPRSTTTRRMGRWVRGLPAGVRDPGVRVLAGAVSRVRRPQGAVIVKSVLAPFSVEWIADRYSPTVVLVRRNLLNVIASWLRNGEQAYPVTNHRLVRDHYLDAIGAVPPPGGASPLASVAWFAGFLAATLELLHRRHPDWRLVDYDLLAADPAPGFRDLAEDLGLQWPTDVTQSAAVRRGATGARMKAYLNPPAEALVPDKWRSLLSSAEVSEILEALSPFDLRGWLPAV